MNKTLSKVFTWMFVGLLITFLTGYYVSLNEFALARIFSGYNYIIIAVIEFILVIYLSARITKMSPTAARICFLLYSFITGITFGTIFIVYEVTSIIYTFLITAIVFGLCALIGKTTKLDLTKMGNYLIIGLLGVILCSIVNIFLKSSGFELILSIITIIIFLGLTAYDIQKIQRLEGIIPEDNLPIYGALELYLDFINIFIELLRFFGKANDN
ncbi:MAG: Bax inhibitor-1/YccA family protein [Bacilli bacterium]|nr:Bax inhibitor-1/YccA family protein [Bacilli bacterium]